MAIQTYDEIQSLLSGDVPAVVYRQARDEVAEFASLLADLQKVTKVDDPTARKIIDRVDAYLNPKLSANDFAINEKKSDVKWSYSTGRFNNNFPITLAAGQQIDAAIAAQSAGGLRGDSEYSALMMTSTGRVAAQIISPFLRRKLSNIPISASLMFGNAQLPAVFAQALLSLPTNTWDVILKDLSNTTNTVSPVVFGRRYTDSDAKRVEQVRRAMLFSQFMNPYMIGPLSGVITTAGAGALGALNGGPEVILQSGQSATLRYDTAGADFLWYWNLDDSSQSDGLEPNMTCQIFLGDVSTPLMDKAISTRDFVFAPTVSVAGMMPIAGSTGGIAAASTPSPGGGWTMLVRRGTKIQIEFNNTNPSTGPGQKSITLRNALGGISLYAPVDLDRLLKTQAGSIQEGR